ncbi:AMP-binding protein, partial [Streptomyces wuyuanensis]|uniref:AMP-binding protein n=1 Tax=Streptomyces wuyuanensis TaxID=1196353 RepID=UPI003798AE8E
METQTARTTQPAEPRAAGAARSDAGREFWREVLAAGGFTAVPRWVSAGPAPGTGGYGTYEATVPGGSAKALGRLAGELGIPFASLVLAAHARVLGVLSGEDDAVTGWVPEPGVRALPCRLAVDDDRTWRALVLDAHRMTTGLPAHRDFPLEELARELGAAEPLYEVEFDPFGVDGDVGAGTVLRVALVEGGDGAVVLRLRYRTDVLDGEAAGRVAGYHLAALERIAADPDAACGGTGLLSAEEVAFQVEGLAGRRRELPGLRVHELFEERVRAHPGAVAVVQGGREWTYGELNGRANRLARALRARGVGAEGVVGVVLERNVDWLASVLAVFKAGGVYLPVEPRFPAGRIAAVLSRAGCRVVLTEPGSTGTLDEALVGVAGVERLLVGTAYGEGHAEGDLGVPVAGDQLAYIYFTSGSTGEPKGAMCEHAGLVNHLFAKIDDLGIVEGSVVAQVAPQCFDISLWQLVAGLLVGG